MVQEMELRSAAAVAKRKADEEAATLKRQRWEAAVAQARLTYREAFRAKALRQQIADWQKALEVREFLSHAADAVTGMASGADRNAAEAWLAWIAGYAERLDPLAGPLRMPHIPEPRPKDLEPHLDGWSPYAP
jgi:hypothetical protein